jgi:hypothetical protein
MARSRARALTLASVLSAIACLVVSGTALATNVEFCQGVNLGSGAGCFGPRHSLTASWSYNSAVDYNNLEAASAVDTNYNQYGTWAYNYGIACHVYSGANLLYPWIYDPSSYPQKLWGLLQYGQTGCNL